MIKGPSSHLLKKLTGNAGKMVVMGSPSLWPAQCTHPPPQKICQTEQNKKVECSVCGNRHKEISVLYCSTADFLWVKVSALRSLGGRERGTTILFLFTNSAA